MSASAHPPRRICLVRLSALGDVCLTVPLLRSLQRTLPDAQLTWIVGREALAIVEGVSGVEFLPFDRKAGWREYFRIRRQLGPKPFDALLALQANWRANALYPFIRARRRIGFDRRRGRDLHGWFVRETIPPAREHFVDAYLSFARTLGLDVGPAEWNLPISSHEQAWARERLARLPRPWLAVNPASSKAERNWPADRYSAVIRAAHERWGTGLLLTGGPSAFEADLARQVLAGLPADLPVVNAVGSTSVRQLFALLREVDVLVSPDTGPAHFADAMGTPVVGLYAVAPAALSGPYRSRHLTVDAHDLAARRFLGRPADELPWNTRVHHPEVLNLITVDAVLDALGRVLSAPSPR